MQFPGKEKNGKKELKIRRGGKIKNKKGHAVQSGNQNKKRSHMDHGLTRA